ncbi:ferritin family protein [bacterium]|nr:ferritin family protein [bacterium]
MAVPRFTIDEVFEMAEQIERNGANFYRAAAEGFDDEKLKDWLLKLAKMEEQHEKVFQKLRAEVVTKADQKPIVFDPQDENVLYLRALASGKVFDVNEDPAGKLTGKEELAEILKIAMGLERDSIIFYVGMKAVIPPNRGQDKVDWIINEEMKHIALLYMAS